MKYLPNMYDLDNVFDFILQIFFTLNFIARKVLAYLCVD